MTEENLIVEDLPSLHDNRGGRERLDPHPPPAPGSFSQRIYDTGVGGWCYYILTTVTPTPQVTDTAPNHTNNLITSSHEVLG
jgi:hypothetical protein